MSATSSTQLPTAPAVVRERPGGESMRAIILKGFGGLDSLGGVIAPFVGSSCPAVWLIVTVGFTLSNVTRQGPVSLVAWPVSPSSRQNGLS